MSDSLPSVLLIGGPDAGKSNFLFRFWMAVDDGKGALVKDRLPDEIEYLRNGAESLQGGKFAARTSKEVIEHVSIPVKSSALPGKFGILNVPDVPGEKVLEVYRERRWPQMWEDKISPSCGCLVFVRAASDEVIPAFDYVQCLALFGDTLSTAGAPSSQALGEAVAATQATSPNDSSDALNYDPPTDVVLTDWLQFLRTAFTQKVSGSFKPRVGIVIAAWDAVPADFQGRLPFEYLKDNFPLTAQFIAANVDRFEFHVFGESVLSGDPGNDSDFKKEFEDGNPTEFGYIIHSLDGKRVKDADMTLPVAWALDWLVSKKA